MNASQSIEELPPPTPLNLSLVCTYWAVVVVSICCSLTPFPIHAHAHEAPTPRIYSGYC